MGRRSFFIIFATLFFIIILVLLGAMPTFPAFSKSPVGQKTSVLKKTSPTTYTTISATSQSQSDLPFPSWWSGICDTNNYAKAPTNPNHLPAYTLPLNAAIPASYRGVVACGPRPTPPPNGDGGPDVLVNFFPGAFGEYEWECVELSMRYMYLAYGIPPYNAPGGKDVANNYTTYNNNPILQPISNPTSGMEPQPGDILSYAGTKKFPTGHTSVVKSTNYTSPGNGKITVLEENFSASGIQTLSMSNWTIGGGVTGWLHHTVDLIPQTASPTSKVNISGSGYNPNEAVNITFDNNNTTMLLGRSTANSAGMVSTTVTIPASATPGSHALRVIGQTSGFSPQTVFYVQTDWPMFGYNAPATRFNTYENTINPSNVSNLAVGWSGMTGNAIYSSPSIYNGVVYVGSGDSNLYAFASSCGTGGTTCLPLWIGSTGGVVASSPSAYKGVIYVGAYDGKLYAFKASGCGQSTCQPLWTANIGNSTTSSPVISNGIVYIGSSSGILYAFKASGCGNPTCLPIWTGTYYGSNNSSPVVANGILYIGDVIKLYAFNASGCGQPTCSPLWTADVGAISSWPAVVNGLLYIGSQDHHLYVFNANGCGQSTCSPLWTAVTGSLIQSAPAVANGVVYIGSEDDNFYAFNANGCGQSTCSPLWTANLGGAIVSAPAVANGVVYIGSYSGFDAFKASGCGNTTCSPIWTASVGGFGTTSSPAVVNGWVYIGSQDYHLYAFHLST